MDANSEMAERHKTSFELSARHKYLNNVPLAFSVTTKYICDIFVMG